MKTAGCRPERIKIWIPGVSIKSIESTFDCYGFKFSLGTFGAFPIFGYPYILKKKYLVSKKDKKFSIRGKSLLPAEFSLGSFGAFPASGHEVLYQLLTFELNIQGSLYCQVITLPAFF